MSAGSKLKGWFQDQKDLGLSFVIEKLLRSKIEGYGRLQEFALNSRDRTAQVILLLQGEAEPLKLEIQEYELHDDPAGSYVTVNRLTTSKAWMTRLLEDFFVGRRLPIPEKYANIAKMLL